MGALSPIILTYNIHWLQLRHHCIVTESHSCGMGIPNKWLRITENGQTFLCIHLRRSPNTRCSTEIYLFYTSFNLSRPLTTFQTVVIDVTSPQQEWRRMLGNLGYSFWGIFSKTRVSMGPGISGPTSRVIGASKCDMDNIFWFIVVILFWLIEFVVLIYRYMYWVMFHWYLDNRMIAVILIK